jgi:CheY-like chemotaxis protein
MVRDWLDELGCETVGPAHTVPAALALIEGALLDGAILDMTIGREDSSAVADALRTGGIPFAFATGRSGDGLAARYPDVPTLAKPYDFAALREVVTGLLSAPVRP